MEISNRNNEPTRTTAAPVRGLSSAERKRILRERAAVLARPLITDMGASEEIEVVLFQLGDRQYAIECSHVVESYAVKELTPLACAPSYVLGIINFRGQIIPLVGLHDILGLDYQPTAHNRILVIDSEAGAVAVHIDSILGVENIPHESERGIAPHDSGSQYYRGTTANGVPVIDIELVIANTRLIAPEEVDEEAALAAVE